MKLIIEIPEEVYKTVQDGSYCGSLYEELKAAIPYNPSGDLISREALKKEFMNPPDRDYLSKSLLELVYKRIDNAPTVEFSPVINMKPLTAEEKQGLVDALKKSGLKAFKLNDEGIRGEWGKWVISEIRCPNCLEYFDTDCYSTGELSKCPCCGAQMKIGGDNT